MKCQKKNVGTKELAKLFLLRVMVLSHKLGFLSHRVFVAGLRGPPLLRLVDLGFSIQPRLTHLFENGHVFLSSPSLMPLNGLPRDNAKSGPSSRANFRREFSVAIVARAWLIQFFNELGSLFAMEFGCLSDLNCQC